MGIYKVGDAVYPAFTPVKAGRIIAVHLDDSRFGFPRYTVRQPNGKEWTNWNVSNFAELVEQHRRKYENQCKVLWAIREME